LEGSNNGLMWGEIWTSALLLRQKTRKNYPPVYGHGSYGY